MSTKNVQRPSVIMVLFDFDYENQSGNSSTKL